MTELVTYAGQQNLPEIQYVDPTGGRLVAWAQAASAANQLAKALSTTNFVPTTMNDPGNATAAILMGDELGLSPLAALRSIYVVHGTPALYARSMVALAQSHGHEIWTESTSEQSVTVCGRRRGSEHVETSTWTIQRATKAKYTTNAKYASNPQEMLYSKAAAEIARKVAADVLAGVPFSVEDLELEEPAPSVPVTRQAASRTRVARSKPEVPEPELDEPETPEAEPEDGPAMPSEDQRKMMFALLGELGLDDRDKYLKLASWSCKRELSSTSELTRAEMSDFIDYLTGRLDEADHERTAAPDAGQLFPDQAAEGK